MKNVLLVHGSFGKPFENWFPWLENDLARQDIRCIVPTFPTPEHQDYYDWSRLLDYYVQMGLVSEETILIGHSCGSVFLARYLSEHEEIKPLALITVAGYNGFISGNAGMDSLNSDFYVDDEELSLGSRISEVHSFYSDNDPFIPAEHLTGFPKAIGAESHLIQGAGHFNSAAGMTEFPQLLELILSM